MAKAVQQGIKITIYQELPKSWDGKKHYMGGFNYLSDEELKEEGFYNVVTPDYNTRSEYLSAIVFDEDKEIFTYNVLDRSWGGTVDELKEDQIGDVKSRAHQYLSKTDWYISRKAEHDTAIPDSIIAKRKDIKDKVIKAETDINALSVVKEIFEYTIQLIENEGV